VPDPIRITAAEAGIMQNNPTHRTSAAASRPNASVPLGAVAKIRRSLGPTPHTRRAEPLFLLVRWIWPLYPQQTKNLLGVPHAWKRHEPPTPCHTHVVSRLPDQHTENLTTHQNERHFSVKISPVTLRAHKTAIQEPFATGSRIATHST
jgi:hypothetical protein